MNGMNAPEYGEPPVYNQPQPAGPQYAPYGPRPPPFVPKKSNPMKKWIVIGMVGMFVMFAGGFLVTLGHWTPPPQTYDFHGSNADSDYSKAVHDWYNTTNSEKFLGRIIMDFGALLVMVMGFLGAVDSNINREERKLLLILGIVSMFIFVVLTVGLWVYGVTPPSYYRY